MSAPRHREHATAILVDPDGRLLLQQRDNDPGILFPGCIGLFGGQREGDETLLECAVRELREETGVVLAPERFQVVLSLDGADPEVAGGTVRATCYVVHGVAMESLVVTEGKLFVATAEEIPALTDRLTPWGRLALARLLRTARPG